MKKHKILLGTIIVLSIVFLILISIYMNQIRFDFNMKKVLIKFESINGLRVDDEIRIRGLKCGRVKNIELTDNEVIVEIQIKNDISISKDSYAGIHDFAIIGGTKYIMLYPGNDEEYKYPMDTLIGKNYDFSIARISIILQNIEKSISDVIPKKQQIDSIISNINHIIIRGNELIQNVDIQLNDISNDVQMATKQVNIILDTLLYSVNILNKQINEYNEKSNTIKKLTTDDSIYIQLKQSIEKLDRILEKLNKNKFIKGCL